MTRLCAVAAPLLLLTYGLLRWIDTGLARDAGHTAFLLAMLCFAVLATLLRPPAGSAPIATTAVTAAILGAAVFGWATAGPAGPAAAPPGPLALIGPLLLQFGLLVLLGLLAFAAPRRLPVWSPCAVLAGFLAVTAGPELLPLGALAIGAGLAPLVRRPPVPMPRPRPLRERSE